MILSYHPCFEADNNLICAGREPDDDDLAAIRAADAVILPQGCCRSLFEMARQNCRNIFPNFDARFNYPGKIGQIRLFRKTNAPHPCTETFLNIASFYQRYDRFSQQAALKFPLVFKFDWGGEGHHVYLVRDGSELNKVLHLSEKFEKENRAGFLIQEYVPSGNRVLRVVVVGQTFISYWRVQNNNQNFCSNLALGAFIDTEADSGLQHAATAFVQNFCRQSGINMAGFDVLFLSKSAGSTPLLLEINYYFGRRGLGGSERFYELLNAEVLKWTDSIGLSL